MRKAVALRYDREINQAPEVVASGQGLLAERILELARAHDVPSHEDQALVEALLKVPVGSGNPAQSSTQLVAQVLAFLCSAWTKRKADTRAVMGIARVRPMLPAMARTTSEATISG